MVLTKKRATPGKCELFDNSALELWLFPISVVLCVVAKEATHMRDTLENLYFGKITPNEQDITPDSVLADAMDRAEQCEEKLPWRTLSWGSDWGCEWPLKLWTRTTAV